MNNEMDTRIESSKKLKQDEWINECLLTQDQIKVMIQDKIERYAKIRSTVRRVVDKRLL